jgi:hypothetical protein
MTGPKSGSVARPNGWQAELDLFMKPVRDLHLHALIDSSSISISMGGGSERSAHQTHEAGQTFRCGGHAHAKRASVAAAARLL